MRKIVSTTWVTVDGYMSGENNDMSFVGQFFTPEMGKYESDIIDTADTILLGRVTYDSFAGSWPHVPDKPDVSEGEKDYAKRLNAMHKIVFSTTIKKAIWNNSEIMNNIDATAILKLKELPGKDMLIYGSASIVQLFTNLNLIDEYQLLVHPIILGKGKPLFKEIVTPHNLKLVSSTKMPSGVVLLKYKPDSK